ncbi:hypothetical protein OJAV_G00009780 [Oryzias javanicus]|uniref:Integrin alpha-2 domain-containing protein n=1 Tax=Oryzias javanicus TaxID=123683 RepID=A0A3S5K3J1_ORYJA|nr:hypothetical protein OJAV_G00009780 [Oryzias javanicus]
MIITYQIDNTGFKDFPVNVSLHFPKQVKENFELIKYQVLVQKNKTQCSSTVHLNSEDCTPEKECVITQCNSFSLKKHSSVTFTLQADVHFRDFHRYVKEFSPKTGGRTEIRFKSWISVDTDRSRYVLASYNEKNSENKLLKNGQHTENDQTTKWSEVRVEIIVLPNQWLIFGTGAGAGLLLLIIIKIILWNLSHFKRKHLSLDEQVKGIAFSKTTEQLMGSSMEQLVNQETETILSKFSRNSLFT